MLMMLSRVFPGFSVAAESEQSLDLEWLAPGRQQIAVVEPKRLQVLDQLVEEFDIEPANPIDQSWDPARR